MLSSRRNASNCHEKYSTGKFVDDTGKAVAFNLGECLETEEYAWPVTYHQRTGDKLEKEHSALQEYLDEFMDFTRENYFKINPKKSALVILNFSCSLDFPPQFKLGREDLEVMKSNL